MSTMPGVIGKYDIPDIVTAIYPLKICIINPVNSLDEMIDSSIFDRAFADAKKKYGNTPNFVAGFKENDVFSRLERWLD
jgi:hypothetical protein